VNAPKEIMQKIESLDLDERFFTSMAIKAMRLGLAINAEDASLRFSNNPSYLTIVENSCRGVSERTLRKISEAIGTNPGDIISLSRFLEENENRLVEGIKKYKNVKQVLIPLYREWKEWKDMQRNEETLSKDGTTNMLSSSCKNNYHSVEEMIPSPDRVRDMIKSKTKELALLRLLLKASEQAAKMDDSKD
jgi:hypothetical protein